MHRSIPLLALLALSAGCRDLKDFMGAVDEDGDGYYPNADDVGFGLEIDCDDSNSSIYPGADDACNSGVDEDCVDDAECYAWAAGRQDLDPAMSGRWSGELANGQLGAVVAGVEVEGEPFALVGAPYAEGGALYLVGWGDADTDAAAGASGVWTGPEGAAFGAALLTGVELADRSYVVVGAPSPGDDSGTIYAVEADDLPAGAAIAVGDAQRSLSPVSGAPYGGALAWSPWLGADEDHVTVLMGVSEDEDGASVIPLSCAAEVGGLACAPGAPLLGEEGSGFGASLAVVGDEESPFLAVAAPRLAEIQLFRKSALEVSQAEPEPTLIITLDTCASGGVRLQAADLQPPEDGVHYGDPVRARDGVLDLFVGLPGCDKVYRIDGETLRAAAGEGASAPISDLRDGIDPWSGGSGLEFGEALSATEDLDGDDVPDLVVGAPGGGDDAQGEVWIFLSRMDALWPDTGGEAPRVQTGLEAGARLGASVAVAPSLDGDAYPELLMGAPRRTYLTTYGGSLIVAQGHGD